VIAAGSQLSAYLDVYTIYWALQVLNLHLVFLAQRSLSKLRDRLLSVLDPAIDYNFNCHGLATSGNKCKRAK
jgi:hypothetical protein